MNERKEHQVVSSHLGKETGRLILKDSTKTEASAYARAHSRVWKSRTVQVFCNGELISGFEKGVKIYPSPCQK